MILIFFVFLCIFIIVFVNIFVYVAKLRLQYRFDDVGGALLPVFLVRSGLFWII